MKIDLTVAAIPAFVGAMAAEYWWQKRHPVEPGTRAGDYQLADTMASLSMGVGSLLAPYVAKKVLDPLTPGVGRFAKVLLAVGAASAVGASVGDVVVRRLRNQLQEAGANTWSAPTTAPLSTASKVTGGLAATAVASTAVTVATVWAAQTGGKRLFEKTKLDLGEGALAVAVGLAGWDFIYYWNHRFMHESRWLWAMHVVHHSSERYNLSTALRQPVADSLTVHVPYGLLALAGVRPAIIEQARALNLIYQFWIHTEAIRSIGWLERVLNTPAHHRVHHGSNRQYLDKNHGSILIIWDRLFGTFEPEAEPVVYGLTKNIDSYNPVVIATHEFADIAADVAAATSWRDRWSYLLRGPGWAYEKRAEPALSNA